MAQEKQVVLKAENIMPVDSLANLQKKMLDPRAYGSCAQSVPGKCLGCPVFERCEFPDKGEGRPRNGGCRVIKKDGGIRETVMACFTYWRQKDNLEASGHLLEWVADEGDEITVRVTKPLRVDVNGVPIPGTTYRDDFDTIKVSEFPTIDKNLNLVNDAYRSEIMQKHHAKKRAEQREAAMAPPAGSIVTETASGDETAGKPKRR